MLSMKKKTLLGMKKNLNQLYKLINPVFGMMKNKLKKPFFQMMTL